MKNYRIYKKQSPQATRKKTSGGKKTKTSRQNPQKGKDYRKKSPKLKVIVLGGLEEVGRNMTVLEFGEEIIIIDMGLQFPEEDMPGIDYIIPNISYLRGKEKNIKGVIITHAHYDHIGAISHLIPKLNYPTIYTGKLSAGIIKKRHEEYKNLQKLKIEQINEKSKFKLGKNFGIEFFQVNHNIPNSFGVVVNTPTGTVVHTGDFKFDRNPINDKPINLKQLSQIGKGGVSILMSDSTDAEHSGEQISESEVGSELEEIFTEAKGRIIIGTFASLLSRVQQIITISEKFGRKVLLEGRSMKSNVEIAYQLGYLKIKKDTLIEPEEFNQYPDNKIVVIGTGAQGERNAVLMRMTNNEHKFLHTKKGDTIVFSSSVIPGNERTVQTLKDSFTRQGAKIYHYKMMDVHAGGHAKQEDLKLMIKLMSPKFFIPIEANHYMLRMHGDLAKEVGIPEKNIFVADNGQIMEFTKNKGRLTNRKVPSDYVMVDGLGVGDVSNIVLRDRRMMAADGMFVVIATIDERTGQLVSSPDIISRGFVYMKESRKLIEESRNKIKKILKDKEPRSTADDNHIKNKIREEIGKFLFKKTQRRPMVLPVVIKV